MLQKGLRFESKETRYIESSVLDALYGGVPCWISYDEDLFKSLGFELMVMLCSGAGCNLMLGGWYVVGGKRSGF